MHSEVCNRLKILIKDFWNREKICSWYWIQAAQYKGATEYKLNNLNTTHVTAHVARRERSLQYFLGGLYLVSTYKGVDNTAEYFGELLSFSCTCIVYGSLYCWARIYRWCMITDRGRCFLDLYLNKSMYILNDRFGTHSNKYTSVSTRG